MTQKNTSSRLLLISFFSLFAVIFAVLYLVFQSELNQKTELPELPYLGSVLSVKLTDQDKQSFNFADLKGDLFVLSFYSKNPNSVNQVINSKLLELQSSLKRKKNIRIISVGMDFSSDSIHVTKSMATYWNANPMIWSFTVSNSERADSIFQFSDSSYYKNSINEMSIYLIDKQGKIRLKSDGMNVLFTSDILTNISTLLRKEHE